MPSTAAGGTTGNWPSCIATASDAPDRQMGHLLMLEHGWLTASRPLGSRTPDPALLTTRLMQGPSMHTWAGMPSEQLASTASLMAPLAGFFLLPALLDSRLSTRLRQAAAWSA